MKLKVTTGEKHTDVVASCCWSPDGQLYSLSDDKTILVWDYAGEFTSKFMDLNNYFTACEWGNSPKIGNELLAIGSSEGSLILLNKTGKIEKTVDNAHSTAIICIKWNSDGQALATGGEDGIVKIWSKQGVLRSKLEESSSPIYSIAWSPDENYMLYTCGKNLSIKPIFKGGNKTLTWKAHDELILCVDWNFSNKLIVSGSEDKTFKLWDQFGRNLFVSLPYNYVTTSVAWAPSGEYFAVGSFDMLRLCNKTGWTYSFSKIDSGSLFKLSWSSDGTTVAGAGGNGSVVFGSIIDRTVNWKNIEVKLDENNKLVVTDFQNDGFQEIDFKYRLIDMTLGHDYLIVVTNNQCHIYNVDNLNTPYKFDIKEKVKMILMCPKYFALINESNGLNIYNYEGKQLQSPQITGVRFSLLSKKMIDISNDIIAILPPNNPKTIQFYDIASGKKLNAEINHTMDINEIQLNQSDYSRDRKVCFTDSNKDLYISNVYIPKVVKISNMCDSFAWNDSNDMLCAIADEKFYSWVYPNAVYLEKEILDGCKYEKDASDIGSNSQILNFTGSICNILKSDGSLCSKSITPYAGLLLDLLVYQDGIEKGLKLCRYVKDKVLWTAFSAICISNREIQIAETAVAAIDEVDKVNFIEKILKLKEQKCNDSLISAYVLLLSNRIDDAEKILLQGNLIYRAIKININLFRWDRALNLAITYKTHVDTVLA
jgi:intraflagellar transport protein 80